MAAVQTIDLRQRGSFFSTLNPYALALVLVGAAFAFTLGLHLLYQARPPLFAFFAAIAAAGWFGGRGAGYLAVAASVPLGLHFYAAARPDHAVHIRDILLFVFFVSCAFAGGTLNKRWRHAQQGLGDAHRALQDKAHELQRINDALSAEIAEHKRTQTALDAMRSELSRVGRLTSMAEMAASIAHEINQPLTAIATNAGACVRWLSAANTQEASLAAERVVGDTERAAAVVARVRAMVRNALAEREPVAIQDCLDDVVMLLKPQMQEQNVTLHWRNTGVRPVIAGDRIQLQQVFFNLLINALESLAPVEGRAKVITIGIRETRENALTITLQDNGAGFGDAVLPRLFESFVTTKPGGMGMGLAIARSIIEAHGGSLTAAPARPYGAIFTITLPRTEDAP